MKSVAGDAPENQRRSLLNEAAAELHRYQSQNHERLQEYQQGVLQLSEFQPEVQVQQVASRDNRSVRSKVQQKFTSCEMMIVCI